MQPLDSRKVLLMSKKYIWHVDPKTVPADYFDRQIAYTEECLTRLKEEPGPPFKNDLVLQTEKRLEQLKEKSAYLKMQHLIGLGKK